MLAHGHHPQFPPRLAANPHNRMIYRRCSARSARAVTAVAAPLATSAVSTILLVREEFLDRDSAQGEHSADGFFD